MYRSGRRWGDEIKRGMGDVDVDVDADTSKARQEVKRLDRDIDRKRTVKIEHDKTSFGALATATRNIEQNFKAVAIAGLALPNTIANVSQSVVQLSGVAGLLPAVVGGAALAIGSLKVATLGFGDAMKNVRDSEKFAESIAQLSPNAQEAANAIRTLLPEIDRLKFTVQDAFFAGLGQQMQQLSTTYLPMFQTAMSQVAASANTALQTVGTMLAQPAMATDVQGMLGNTTSAINILSQALAPVVKAFVDIGLVGSGFLPQLAAAATQAANQFAMFIDKARATGDLQKWIQGGIDAMSTLGRIAGDIFNIFMKFAGFDTQGGGLLGMIEGITSTVSDFVNSPAGQGMLQSFITQVGATTAAILPVLGSLLQALAPVMGIFGQISGTIIQSLAPAFDAWLQAMTPVIAQVVGALRPVLAALAPVLSEVANTLATQMISGIQQILPVLIPFVQQMGALLVAVLPMIPPLVQLATSAMPLFQQALAILLPILTQYAQILTTIATASMPQLLTMTKALGDGFTLQFTTIGNVVRATVGLVGPLLDALTQKIQALLDGPLGKFVNLMSGPIPRMIGLVANAPATPSGSSASPFPSAAAPGGGGLPGAQRDRRGAPPIGPAAGPALPAPYTPPVSPYIAPLPASGGGGGGSGGATPSTVSPTGTDWEKVAQGESKGNWAINTGNGYYGGLQFDLPTWKEFGGTEFAERPDLASKEQQIAVAERVPPAQRPNRWPNTYAAGAVGRPPAGSTASAVSSGYPDTSGYSASAAPQDPRSFAHDVMMPYWQQQGLTVGDHEADQFGEHQHGALDIMVPDIATGNQVLQQVLSDPNVYGAIFNSQSYGYGHGATGKPYGGANPHTDHVHAWYKPGGAGNITPPGAAGYPTDMGGYGGGFDTTDYTGYKGTREAQEKVDDAAARIAGEQSKLDALRVKSGVTPDEIAEQERKVAKAKREHRDALEDLTAAQNKYNDAAGKAPGSTGGDFGKDFMGGILEFFGFDGSLFKNPAEFGLVKLLGGFSKLKPRGEGGSGLAPGDSGGGGSGLESFLTSIIPQPFGPVQPGGSNSAPGQFFPNMPGSDSGGVLGRAFAPAGAPGPGNAIDNSININNPMGQDHLRDSFQQAESEQYPRRRSLDNQFRNLP